MKRTRIPRPVRRMGTEVHQDRRTRRRRARSTQEYAAIFDSVISNEKPKDENE